MKNYKINVIVCCCLLCCGVGVSFSQQNVDGSFLPDAERRIRELMEEGDIPGLSVVMIKDGRQYIRTYGHADQETGERVTTSTLFEIGSCSKAFTALAVASLVHQNRLKFDDPVTEYIPWFRVTFKDTNVKITVRQLLHHTSGIPWSTISKIPQTSSDDALEQTVRQLVNQELDTLPGKLYQYATVNYDVLALIVQNVTQQPFEKYLQQDIIDRLHLRHTTIGFPADSALKSKGYKIGFFRAREYQAPIFRGNNAAGYIMSDVEDIAKWLRFQMGDSDSEMFGLAKLTHQRDETVPLHNMSSYAMGWEISLRGNGEIYHGGLNPNYSAYIAFRPQQKIGVAVMANANSNYTPIIANALMKLMVGEKVTRQFDPGDGNDKTFAVISMILCGYILVVTSFVTMVVIDIAGKRRIYDPPPFSKWAKFAFSLMVAMPFLYGIYILPEALFEFTWEAIIVWTPISFPVALILLIISLGISYFARLLTLCFPEKNKFKRVIPQLVLLSILSGLANMGIIVLITSSLNSNIELKYLLFYYGLTLSVYLFGRRYVQINLVRFSADLTYELRMKLIEKIFSTSYHRFEKMDRGRVYTSLNDDVGTIADSANMFVMLVTFLVTAIAAFLYLSFIAFWATLVTVFLIVTLATLYFFVSNSTNKYYEEARDSRNVFMRLINGLIDGFKELSLHRNKKLEYKDDVSMSAEEFKTKTVTANIRFVNASLVGESVLILLLGTVVFAIPRVFPGIPPYAIMSFVVLLLYLIGPINGILNSVPGVMRLRIAWNRIQEFLQEIPANLDLSKILPPLDQKIESIRTRGLKFQYRNASGQDDFAVGPIDLEVMNGEILFIIGGNGSGKTTLAKLITGLYEPDEGEILIKDKVVGSGQLGEYFSAVFNPLYLFEKLYNADSEKVTAEGDKYLELLDLKEKLEIVDNKYSTINLSGGQRKRLALLQCYFEDAPIYLFDEWAADQDPAYRQFFYRTLLPAMKRSGKIVIAITHDDHYFDVADKVLKMNHGKLEVYTSEYPVTAIDAASVRF